MSGVLRLNAINACCLSHSLLIGHTRHGHAIALPYYLRGHAAALPRRAA